MITILAVIVWRWNCPPPWWVIVAMFIDIVLAAPGAIEFWVKVFA